MRKYFARCLLSLWSLLLVGIVACGDATNPTSPSGSGGPLGAGAGDFNRTLSEGTPPGGGVTELSCAGTPPSGTPVPSGSFVSVTVTAVPNPGAGVQIFFEEFCDGVSQGTPVVDPPGPTDVMGEMKGSGPISCPPGEEFRIRYTMPSLDATSADCSWPAT